MKFSIATTSLLTAGNFGFVTCKTKDTLKNVVDTTTSTNSELTFSEHILKLARKDSDYNADTLAKLKARRERRRELQKKKKSSSMLLPNEIQGEKMQHLQEVLTNKQFEAKIENAEECDPTHDKEADVGILTCSEGQHCMDSSDSSLGGVCVDKASYDRFLQQDTDSDTPLLDVMTDLCTTNNNDEDLTCNTCMVTGDYTADIDCSYKESCYTLASLCDNEVIDFCSMENITATLDGPNELTYQACYNFTKPVNFSYCTTYIYEPNPDDNEDDVTCEMTVNGTKCNSCTLIYQEQSLQWCKYFDCDNTPLEVSSSVCDYSIMEAFSTDYLYKQLPCSDGCNLCGDNGEMSTPSRKSFTIPNVATLNCLQTQLTALTGGYNSEQCDDLEELVDEPCGCDEKPPTAAPTPEPRSDAAGISSSLVAAAATTGAVATMTALNLV